MGRHHQKDAGRSARTALCAGAVGFGVLQAAVPAFAAPAAPAPAPAAAPAAPASGTPCAATAKACVDISAKKAWLTDGHGKVIYGAVPVTTGADGLETPTGTFSVMWKDKDHKSGQYDGADMKNSVFFQPGDAFHEGNLGRDSAGCVHLSPAASEKFFDYLQVYDQVQIIP